MNALVADDNGSAAVAVGWVALVSILLVMTVVVAALFGSFAVKGRSMEPTLTSGERILLDPLHNDEIERFDLVQGIEPGPERFGGGGQVVKRVIGLPGDRVAIVGGEKPVVYVSPDGAGDVFRVDNPAWPTRIGTEIGMCCEPDGTYDPDAASAAWVTVPDDALWVVGDNWGGSTDSRAFGFLPAGDVSGKAWLRLLPVASFGRFGDGGVELVEETEPVAGLGAPS
ncbi:signal peptidase I [Nocardioides sp. KC13]|uniref:Signal peptidase I n=1 Tax=Nocardioides turkmenicus TaxID=2711220 RepID=A0A6M1R0D2_9ACTN|nr:signal peptidase I [Nocardioides sp. KC13]NGN95725.1 signal peptidase I [Nocardioides sp. KC13]